MKLNSASIVAATTAVLLFAQIFPGKMWTSPSEEQFQVIRHFSLPHGQYQKGHRGIDLKASESENVVSPVTGVVTFVGTVVDRPVISIRFSSDVVVTLEPIESSLSIGDSVLAGTPLGRLAPGGHCHQKCIHLGVRHNNTYVNPIKFFRDKPVLLP